MTEQTTSAGRIYWGAETVTYFHGTFELYRPITQAEEDARGKFCTCADHMRARREDCPSMAGGSWVESVECPHRHKDPEAAQECARKLAAREIRARNNTTRR